MPFSSPFRPEPPYAHGQAEVIGLLWCNLGTPEAPTPAAVRRYLAQFLADPRVVEIPRLLWLPLLWGVILPLRSRVSAAKYQRIWSPEGSPLAVWTARQAQAVEQALRDAGHQVRVRHAMRYGQPAIDTQLDALRAQGATRILVLPAYPQYSGTTTASIGDAVGHWAAGARHRPELRLVNRYHDDPRYIAALAASIEAHWRQHGRPDHLLLSFHGVPERTLHLGDPYHCECRKTARLLAEHLALAPGAWSLAFQSRFGRAKWLEPYTEPSLVALAQAGIGRVDVACPGFTADCLETLEEIDIEARQAFLAAGGREFHYIGCLNAQPAWIGALAGIAADQLVGWPTRTQAAPAQREASRERAMAIGAPH